MYRPDFTMAKDARVLQTREALRTALLRLLKKKCIDRISIREIVSNTFFRHYQDKESILEDIAAGEINRLVSLSMTVLEAEDTLAACFTLCNHVAENKKLWKTLLTGGAAEALRREFVRVSREVVEHRPRGKEWLPLDIAVILVTSGIFELLSWWLSEKDPLPVDKVALICQQIVVSPVIEP